MIRVFVGCAPDGADAESQAVLEHTLRSRSSLPVDITWMIASRDPASLWYGWDKRRWATPFSGFRWSVPYACGFDGRAIYMDSDTIVNADIAELWRLDLPAGAVAAARSAAKFCISLWDCERARAHLLPLRELRAIDGHDRQTAHFRQRPGLVHVFDPGWNFLDDVETRPLREAKVIHYTALDTQPHLRHALLRLQAQGRRHWYDGPRRPHPRRDIVERFETELAIARDAGYDPARYVPVEAYGELGKRAMGSYRRGAR